jgi:hypothetical protein
VLVQGVETPVGFVTEVTLPILAVPGHIRGSILFPATPVDGPFRNQPSGVLGAYKAIDIVAVEIGGVGAGSAFKMMYHARRSGVAIATEQTLNGDALVGS